LLPKRRDDALPWACSFQAARRKSGLQRRLEIRRRLTDTFPQHLLKRSPKRPARRPTLRSSLVYAASKEIPNRFQLCQTISKATRKLHLASMPTQSTINRVLLELAEQPAA
jgi:hypothetical protein